MTLAARARLVVLVSLVVTPPLLGLVPGWVSISLVPLAISVHLALLQVAVVAGLATTRRGSFALGIARHDVLLLVFLGLLPFSLRAALEPLASLEYLVWWLSGAYLYFALPALLVSERAAATFRVAVVGAATFAAAFSLPAVLEGVPGLCASCEPVIRHHRNITALYVLPGFFLALWRLAAARGRATVAAWTACVALMSLYLVFSRCRAVWLALAGALPFLAWWALRARGAPPSAPVRAGLRRRPALSAGLALGALALAVAVALAPPVRERVVESQLFVTATTLMHPTEGSAGGRLQLWRTATLLIQDHLASGVGLAQWKESFHPYRNALGPAPYGTYAPLNSFLRLLGELGLVRFLLFMAFLAAVLVRTPDTSGEARVLRVALAAMLFAALFHVTLFEPALLLMLWLTLALLRRHGPAEWTLRLSRRAATACAALGLVLFGGATVVEGAFTTGRIYGYVVGPFVDYASGTPRLWTPGPYGEVLSREGSVGEVFAYREHPAVLRQLGRLHYGEMPGILEALAVKEHGYGELEAALGWAEAALARSPDDPRMLARRCEIERDLGRLEQAARSCVASLARDPYAPEPSVLLAEIQEARGEERAALGTRVETRARFEGRIAAHLGQVSLQPEVADWQAGRRANERALRALRERLGVPVPRAELLTAIARSPVYNKAIVTDPGRLWFSGTASGAFDLWAYDLATGEARLASNDRLAWFRLRRAGASGPLFFVSDRDGDYRYALYRRDPETGAPRPLTSRRGGASQGAYEPSPDGRHLAYVDERGHAADVHLLETESLDTRQLTHEGRRIQDLAWAPTSDQLFFVQGERALVRYDLATGRLETLLELAERTIRWPAVSPSGERVAFVARDAQERSEIRELDLRDGTTEVLTDEPDAYFMSLAWLDDERLLYRRQVDDLYRLGVLTRSSRSLAPLGPADGVVYEVEPGADGRSLVFFFGDARIPVAPHRLDLETGAWERLLDQDGIAPGDALVHETHLRETAHGNLRIYVYTPPDTQAGAPRPCVIWLPGSGGYSPRWNPYVQYLAHAGFVVATFNFNGLPGSPQRVLEGPAREHDPVHVEQMTTVHELLAALPQADASRVALVGVSRGARLVEAGLLARPDRFRAGVELAGPPNELLAEPRPGMPPLLLVLGRNDAYVPLDAKRAQAATQREAGNAVEVLVLDDEGHDLRAPHRVEAALERTVRFLRERLGDEAPNARPAETHRGSSGEPTSGPG